MSIVSLREEDCKAFVAAYELVQSYALSKVIKATIELEIFDLLAISGPNAELTAEEIIARLSLGNNKKTASLLDHMLGHLASHSILTSSSSVTDREGRLWKRYGLTPTGRLLSKTREGPSLAPFFLLTDHKSNRKCWKYLKEAVQNGVSPCTIAFGSSTSEHMAKDPALSNLFNVAMENMSNIVVGQIINIYKDGFVLISELVDVGGGTGATLGNIISEFPHIKGINFDLPHVISKAPSIPGVEHIGGDMLKEIPSGGAILMKWILHNWDDQHCLAILKNCWRALPTFGKVIIIEYVLPETDLAPREVYATSIVMMVLYDGAKERTEKEFRTLAKEASFSEFKICGNFLNLHIMELIK